ncbi:AMP-dependent synthetase and ligase [Candidatus Moduliflexus flocculans]|uniref:AMP-dependent synthetase and ligase n=1 Tax=Candidatus Moduliflexus flocculans TaxID=1499966 RepID=A0A0S6VZI3_9BACT|nr:AMP-dependent synthetase and ligase [Candidatus Moduliflexus flocculans]
MRYNISQALCDMAARAPYRAAIVFPAGRDARGRAKFTQLTFQQLNALCDSYAHGLAQYGIKQGDRTLMMIRPGMELIAVTFALLKIGAVPVLIDPGMGRKAFLQCVAETEPTALIGIPLAHVMRKVFPKPFRNVRRFVTVGKRLFWDGATLAELQTVSREPFPVAPTTTEDEAAVAFTSGGTGIPKGVVYLHGIFKKQVEIMRDEMGVKEGETHLSVMYIFALFNPALGVTTIIPDMDARKTAQVNPAYLVESIETFGVTMSLGSPLIWSILADYCSKRSLTLPSLQHVFMFGAEVMPDVVKRFAKAMPNGKIYTPYGATEALPLTLMPGEEILAETGAKTLTGAGVCVGKPIGGLQARIIPISDEPIAEWNESLALPTEQIGEIVIKGEVVTREYVNRPRQTAEAKIRDDSGFWHRMGDLGYLDEQGRIWVCGRKSHRVETPAGLLLPVQVEAVFTQHPAVKRAALVGIGAYGQQQPVVILETQPAQSPRNEQAKQQLIDELRKLGEQHEHTRAIRAFFFHPSFPVDVRHNTKIDRLALRDWAARQYNSSKAS